RRARAGRRRHAAPAPAPGRRRETGPAWRPERAGGPCSISRGRSVVRGCSALRRRLIVRECSVVRGAWCAPPCSPRPGRAPAGPFPIASSSPFFLLLANSCSIRATVGGTTDIRTSVLLVNDGAACGVNRNLTSYGGQHQTSNAGVTMDLQ